MSTPFEKQGAGAAANGAPKPETPILGKPEPARVQRVHQRVLERCVLNGRLICRLRRIWNPFRRRNLILATLKRYPPDVRINMAFQRLRHWGDQQLLSQARASLQLRSVTALPLGWRTRSLAKAVQEFGTTLIRKLPDR